MQTIALHGYCTSLPQLVDLVRLHIGIRSVISFDRPGASHLWQDADNDATPEVLTGILTEDMDLATALERVETFVVTGS
jgi:hypothetical protein